MRAAALVAFVATFLLACNGALRFDEPGPADAGVPPADASPDARPLCSPSRPCGHGLQCDLEHQQCVECTTNAHCAPPRSQCDPTSALCVGCLASADCGLGRTCEKTTHRCVDACEDHDDLCPIAGQICHDDAKMCVECFRDAQCGATPHRPHCDPRIGRCVACRGAADCPSDAPACDQRDGACVGCVGSSWCKAPNTVCDPGTRTCVP